MCANRCWVVLEWKEGSMLVCGQIPQHECGEYPASQSLRLAILLLVSYCNFHDFHPIRLKSQEGLKGVARHSVVMSKFFEKPRQWFWSDQNLKSCVHLHCMGVNELKSKKKRRWEIGGSFLSHFVGRRAIVTSFVISV